MKRSKVEKSEPVPSSFPPDPCKRIRITDKAGRSIEGSVIHVWERGKLAADDVDSFDAAITVNRLAVVFFRDAPMAVKVAYVWVGHCPLMLGVDSQNRYFDVSGAVCQVEQL